MSRRRKTFSNPRMDLCGTATMVGSRTKRMPLRMIVKVHRFIPFILLLVNCKTGLLTILVRPKAPSLRSPSV